MSVPASGRVSPWRGCRPTSPHISPSLPISPSHRGEAVAPCGEAHMLVLRDGGGPPRLRLVLVPMGRASGVPWTCVPPVPASASCLCRSTRERASPRPSSRKLTGPVSTPTSVDLPASTFPTTATRRSRWCPAVRAGREEAPASEPEARQARGDGVAEVRPRRAGAARGAAGLALRRQLADHRVPCQLDLAPEKGGCEKGQGEGSGEGSVREGSGRRVREKGDGEG